MSISNKIAITTYGPAGENRSQACTVKEGVNILHHTEYKYNIYTKYVYTIYFHAVGENQ